MAMKVRTTNQTGANQNHLNASMKPLIPILRNALLRCGDDLSSAIFESIDQVDSCMLALYRRKPYFIFEGKAMNKMVSVDSPEFLGFIAKSVKLAQGKSVAPRAMSLALESLKNEVILDGLDIDGSEYNAYLDASNPASGVLLDINDPEGRGLLMQDGRVQLAEVPTELTFVDKPSKGALSYVPLSESKVSLEELHALFSNLDKSQFYLVLAYITFIFAHPRNEGLTFPMLYVYGSAGTGKTTVVKLITKLLGLGEATVKSLPKSVRDLVAIAANDYVLCFDNVSNISDKLSNAFCNVVTGSTVTDRTLHTNIGTTDTVLHQPMIMTAISLPKQYDLSTRAIFLNSSKPTKRYKNEREIFQLLDNMLPEVQSCLLDATAKTLVHLDDVESIVDHRAASFTQWVAAFEKTIGIEDQSIQKFFTKATEEGLNQQTAEHNPIITSIAEAARECGEFSGTPTEVYRALTRYIEAFETRLPRSWPANANAMSIKLNNSVGLLAKQGVEWFVDAKRGTNGRKATLRSAPLPVQDSSLSDDTDLELVSDNDLDWNDLDFEDTALENASLQQYKKKTQEESDAELLALLG